MIWLFGKILAGSFKSKNGQTSSLKVYTAKIQGVFVESTWINEKLPYVLTVRLDEALRKLFHFATAMFSQLGIKDDIHF